LVQKVRPPQASPHFVPDADHHDSDVVEPAWIEIPVQAFLANLLWEVLPQLVHQSGAVASAVVYHIPFVS